MLPVLNLNSPLAEVRKGAKGALQAFLIPPWNSFFQQFTQPPPAVADVELVSGSNFTPNRTGNLIFTGGNISNITLTRGSVSINLTGQRIIPVSLNDTVSVTYSIAPVVQFLGA